MGPTTPQPTGRIRTPVIALECIRCGRTHPATDHSLGCPDCADEGSNANLFCRYPEDLRAVEELVPYRDVPDLGQGNTPLISLPWLDGVLVKDETANPTGSHKDRFAAMITAHALARGYRSLIIGSSGNAGLAVAAFAAAAGLRAVVAGFSWFPPALRSQLEHLGAQVRTFDSVDERTSFVLEAARGADALAVSNVADVVVGSNCFGIEGYKAIAWEIAQQSDGRVDHVVIPSSRGDLAWGVFRGFCDLTRLHGTPVPRLHLVEPFPRLAAVLAGADITDRFTASAGPLHSIAGDSTTAQAHATVTRSAGSAVVVPDELATTWYERAGRHGHPWEISSCTVLAAYADLRRRGVISAGERAVLIATSHFFKGL